MKIEIIRQISPVTKPYAERFDYVGPDNISVAALLDHLNTNDDLINDKGEKTGRIGWECSCLQASCGACAMVINGSPALACEVFLNRLKGDIIRISPLKKFPVIHDLIVDRSSIQENLKSANMYIGEYKPSSDRDTAHQYSAAKCLKCGLCLEVCPNYTSGKTFFGAAFANDCYLVASRNREKAKEIGKIYKKHFGKDCSKSLSCMDVCPVGIQTIASIAKLNK